MRCWIVDAFTDRSFRGNPAGVVLLDAAAAPPAAWLQDVAAELKHSETAFLTPRPDGGHDLRWFTPGVEVDLCGHATLAAAHVLHELGGAGPFAFHTRSGVLTAGPAGAGIALDFPSVPTRALPDAPDLTKVLADVLGAAPRLVLGAGDDVLAELDDEDAVARLDPDLAAFARLACRGVVVTAAADAGTEADFVSRWFGAGIGVDEDPVTGSAHCALGPFWAQRLGRSSVVGAQLSARGGRVAVDVQGERVQLWGQAVTVLAGTLSV